MSASKNASGTTFDRKAYGEAPHGLQVQLIAET